MAMLNNQRVFPLKTMLREGFFKPNCRGATPNRCVRWVHGAHLSNPRYWNHPGKSWDGSRPQNWTLISLNGYCLSSLVGITLYFVKIDVEKSILTGDHFPNWNYWFIYDFGFMLPTGHMDRFSRLHRVVFRTDIIRVAIIKWTTLKKKRITSHGCLIVMPIEWAMHDNPQ